MDGPQVELIWMLHQSPDRLTFCFSGAPMM
jgi:hypothetical protein